MVGLAFLLRLLWSKMPRIEVVYYETVYEVPIRELGSIVPPRPLDRCDTRPAGARVAFLLPGSESPLMLCGHHFRQHESAIRKLATEIQERIDN